MLSVMQSFQIILNLYLKIYFARVRVIFRFCYYLSLLCLLEYSASSLFIYLFFCHLLLLFHFFLLLLIPFVSFSHFFFAFFFGFSSSLPLLTSYRWHIAAVRLLLLSLTPSGYMSVIKCCLNTTTNRQQTNRNPTKPSSNPPNMKQETCVLVLRVFSVYYADRPAKYLL